MPRTPALSLLAVGLLAYASPALAAGASRPKLAVTDLRAGQGVSEGAAALLTGVAVSEASRTQRFEVLAKSDLAALLGFERQKELAGCADDTGCLAVLGGALGAQYMLIGTVGKLGTRGHVSLTLLDVKKSQVVARQAELCPGDEDALTDAVLRATRKLLGVPEEDAAPKDARVSTATTSRGANVPGWTALAGGAALLVAGGISAGVAATGYDALASHRGDANYADRFARERSGIESAALAADVLLGLGVAAAGVGAVLLLTGAGGPDGHASVAPAVGPGFAGVVGTGRF